MRSGDVNIKGKKYTAGVLTLGCVLLFARIMEPST